MAMDVAAIRGWLLWNPRPMSVKVQTSDDREHEVSVTSGVSWMAMATSIHALDPILVQAFDAEGKIIRACRPKEHGDTGEDGTQRPANPLVLPPGTDPQSLQLLHFADLLAAAYRHSTDVAFERLASLFEASNRRSESLERSLETMNRLLTKAHQQQIEAAATATPDKEDQLGELVQAFMQGRGAAAETDETPPNGNGKVG